MQSPDPFENFNFGNFSVSPQVHTDKRSISPLPLESPPRMRPRPVWPVNPALPSGHALPNPVRYPRGLPHVQPAAPPHPWGNYPGFQPVWSPPLAGSEFVSMCQTSVGSVYSVHSAISTAGNPFRDPPRVACGVDRSLPGSGVDDVYKSFFELIVSRLSKRERALAVEKDAVKEMLQIAALLVERDGGTSSRGR